MCYRRSSFTESQDDHFLVLEVMNSNLWTILKYTHLFADSDSCSWHCSILSPFALSSFHIDCPISQNLSLIAKKISWFTTLNALYWVCSTCFFKAYVPVLPAFLFRFGSDPTNQLNSLDDLHSYNHPLYFSVLPSIFGHLAHPLLCKHFLHIKIARPGCAFGTLYLIFLSVFYEQSTCTLSYAKGYFFSPLSLDRECASISKKLHRGSNYDWRDDLIFQKATDLDSIQKSHILLIISNYLWCSSQYGLDTSITYETISSPH